MSDFINVILNFLSYIVSLEIFLYFLAAVGLISTILLIKKVIY